MPDKLSFHSLSDNSPFLDTVSQWIFDEWSKDNGDSLDTIREKLLVKDESPTSKVAVEKTAPVGFVWISRYRRPEDSSPTLWINGLYVKDSHRSRGIGSSLVQLAEQLSSNFEDELYAYTEIPEFYLQLGWRIHQGKNASGNAVVRQKLNT